MTRDQLKWAQDRASNEDKQRLQDGYETLGICTTDDLGNLDRSGVQVRRGMLARAVESMQSLDPDMIQVEGVAWNALLELQARLRHYDKALS